MAVNYDPITGNISTSTEQAQTPAEQHGIPQAVLERGQVPMLNPEGKPVYVSRAELGDALSQGYKYESPEMEKDRKLEDKYGGNSLLNESLAGAAGAARGISFGLSDAAGRTLGFADALRELKKRNPVASTVGEFTGAALPALLTEGGSLGITAGSKAATKGIANVIVRKTAQGALEGAAYGAGAGVSQTALQEQPITAESAAENVLLNAGIGAVLGGGISLVTSAAGAGGSKLKEKIGKLFSKEPMGKAAVEAAEATAAAEGSTVGGLTSEPQTFPIARANITQGPTTGTIVPAEDAIAQTVIDQAPKSLDELVALQKARVAAGETFEMPQAARLREIVEEVPDLTNKPLGPHYEMLQSKQKFDIFRTDLRTLPSAKREAFEAYETAMKKEVEGKIYKVASRDGVYEPVTPAVSGQKLIDDVGEIYKTNKKTSGQMFEAFKKTEFPTSEHIPDLVIRIADEVPVLGKTLEVTQEGTLAIKPFSSTLGVSKQEYGALKQVVADLNSPNLGFKDMQNIREFLRKEMDPLNYAATSNLSGVRKAMLNHMEKLIEAYGPPGAKVRDAFTSYAKNEAFLEQFETVLGGKVESFNALYRADPDKVLGKVFNNVNTVGLTKELLGEARFAQVASDYVNGLIEKSTDTAKNQMSMARFAQQLKQNRSEIIEAIGPDQFRRLENLTDLGRIIPDAPPVNPSGTAKTGLISGILRGGKQLINLQPGQAIAEIAGALDENIAARQAIDNVNQFLAGKKVVEQANKQTFKQVAERVQDFLAPEVTKGARAAKDGLIVAALNMKREEHQTRLDLLADLATNADLMTDLVAKKTQGLSNVDDKIHQVVNDKLVQAVQYLHEKAPKNPGVTDVSNPLDRNSWQPSDQALAKWNRYVRAVDNPMSILDDLNDGILTNEAVEAVRSIYPELYGHISQQVLTAVADEKEPMSYQKKMQLSILLGTPLTSSAKPEFVQAMQAGFLPAHAEEQPTGGGQIRTTQGGLKKLNQGSATQTQVEKILNR